MTNRWILEPLRVEFQLDGKQTKVLLEWAKNWIMTARVIDWDIPTNSIPPDLRTIGSGFLLSRSRLDRGEYDSFEQIRRIYPMQIVKLV